MCNFSNLYSVLFADSAEDCRAFAIAYKKCIAQHLMFNINQGILYMPVKPDLGRQGRLDDSKDGRVSLVMEDINMYLRLQVETVWELVSERLSNLPFLPLEINDVLRSPS